MLYSNILRMHTLQGESHTDAESPFSSRPSELKKETKPSHNCSSTTWKGEGHFTQANVLAEYTVASYKSSNPLIHSLAICERKNSKWKKDMEDATVFLDRYGGKDGASFIGVFDGFHGQSSAVTASRELPILILDQLSKQDPSLALDKDEARLLSSFEGLFPQESPVSDAAASSEPQQGYLSDVRKAVVTAFRNMDCILALGRNETSRVRWSGCTTVVCLIDIGNEQRGSQESPGGQIVIANCGNIHAVLCKQGKAFCLTEDHSTSNSKERQRIIKNGGSISLNRPHGLVEGLTKATRGLGHFGDVQLKKSVIPVPYVLSLPFDPSFQLLVLASSGLWEVLDISAVAKVAETVIERTKRSCVKTVQLDPDSSAEDQSDPRSPLQTLAEVQTCENRREMNDDSRSQVLTQEITPVTEGTLVIPPRSVPTDYEHLTVDICRELVEAAMELETKENVSVVVVLFQGFHNANGHTHT